MSEQIDTGISRSRQKKLNKSMDTLFPQERPDCCRVCNEPVVDGRWNYCSTRCRKIANAVQSMFIWSTVRDQILDRDDSTCQECGLSEAMAWRAYWQSHELFDHLEDRDRFWELVPEAPTGLLHVDHIERIADGGHPFDESNLRTLCKDCHHAKTAEENSTSESAPQITLEDYFDA